MNTLDLFSGIGGFSLGLERTSGFRTVQFCEIEPFCQQVLRKHWPDVPIHDDVRTLNGYAMRGTVDVVCGGFPCQPWSLAGKRQGRDDSRDLWPEMRRIISEVRPRWVIGENVPGLDDKRFLALDGVLVDLESLGYEARAFEIPACGVNAPHKRARLWIVGHRTGLRWNQKHKNPARGGQGNSQGAQHGPRNDGDVGNTLGTGLERREGIGGDAGEKRPPAERDGGSGHWDEHEWLIGPDGKARRIKSGVRLLAHGLPGRLARLKALGNSIVPQIATMIGMSILEAEQI